MKKAATLLKALFGLLLVTNLYSSDSLIDLSFHPPYLNSWFTNEDLTFRFASALRQDDRLILAVNPFPIRNGSPIGKIFRLMPDGTLDDQFAPQPFTGYVAGLHTLSNGEVLVGGNHSEINGFQVPIFSRLFAGGPVDPSFLGSHSVTGFEAGVLQMETDSLGRIYASGWFILTNSTEWVNLARFDSNGELDETFPKLEGYISGQEVLPNGKVLVSGDYSPMDDGRHIFIARYDPDGTEDSTFNVPSSLSAVMAMTVQADQKILVAQSSNLVRLLPDGAIDPSFKFDYEVPGIQQILARADGRILVSGWFGNVKGFPRNGIAQFLTNGILDSEFVVEASGENIQLKFLAEQSDGRVILGGHFTNVNGIAITNLVRLNYIPLGQSTSVVIDPTLDFAENTNLATISISRAGDVSYPITVQLSTIDDTARSGVDFVGLNTNLTFAPDVRTIQAQVEIINNDLVDGLRTFKIRLAENETTNVVPGGSITNTALIHDDEIKVELLRDVLNVSELTRYATPELQISSYDSFVHNANPEVIINYRTVPGTAQPGIDYNPPTLSTNFFITSQYPRFQIELYDNRSYEGTREFQIELLPSPGLILGARTNTVIRISDNDNLAGYAQGANGPIFCSAVQPDGKVLMGGDFTFFDGLRRNRLVRLNPDTTVDESFDAGEGFNDSVDAIAIDGLNRIVVSGEFNLLNGSKANHIARLNPDGTRDESFNSGDGWSDRAGNTHIWSVVTGTNNEIYAASMYLKFDGQDRLGGIVRLQPNGSLDNAFNPPILSYQQTDQGVCQLIMEPDGNLLVNGTFAVGSLTNQASGFARVTAMGEISMSQRYSNMRHMVLTADGKIVLQETSSDRRVFRFLSDGSPDSTFAPTKLQVPSVLLALPDGRLMAGASFPRILLIGAKGGTNKTSQFTNFFLNVSTFAPLKSGNIMIGASQPNHFGYYGVGIIDSNAAPVENLEILPPVVAPDGGVHIRLTGQTNRSYALQRSYDLSYWDYVIINSPRYQPLNPKTPIDYPDKSAAGCFYRIRY